MIPDAGGGAERRKEGAGLDNLLDGYLEEVLRWNRQISLISRNQPERHVRALTESSLDCIRALPEILAEWDQPAASVLHGDRRPSQEPAAIALRYIDIGSGAGLPGVIWHAWLVGIDSPIELRTCLIEPRSKRAWFLERIAKKLDLSGMSVLAARWGEIQDQAAAINASHLENCLWLLSLRALRMSEQAVIQGWKRMMGLPKLPAGHRLAVCRFRSPTDSRGYGPQREPERPVTESEDAKSSEGFRCRGTKLHPCGSVSKPTVALQVSFYRGDS